MMVEILVKFRGPLANDNLIARTTKEEMMARAQICPEKVPEEPNYAKNILIRRCGPYKR